MTSSCDVSPFGEQSRRGIFTFKQNASFVLLAIVRLEKLNNNSKTCLTNVLQWISTQCEIV